MLPVPDRDAAGGRVDRDPDRGEHRLGLEQAGRRGPVGEDQAVDDEVAVVHALAEVAAVARSTVRPSGSCWAIPWSIHSQTKPPCSRGCRSNELAGTRRGRPARCPSRGAYSHSMNGRRATVLVVLGVAVPAFGAAGRSRRLSRVVAYIRRVDVGVRARPARPRSAPAGPGRGRGSSPPSRPGSRPVPASLPSDHMITLGWFLSRSTVRSIRSRQRRRQRRIVAGVAAPAGQREAVRLQVALVDHPQAVARRTGRGTRGCGG